MRDKISKDIRDSIAVKESVLQGLVPQIEKASAAIIGCLKKGNKVLFFGNGGSAADAQHLAAEIVGRYEKERKGYPSIALTTDTSILTAVGNDYGFDTIFERQIEALGRAGDVAYAISTSGNSKNVMLGVKKAMTMGLLTIGVTGKTGGELAKAVDISINVPSSKTARIQESHLMIGHIICERVDEAL